jgi:hypothetical protein
MGRGGITITSITARNVRADQEARRALLDWLRTEFAVESPGQRLEAFASLDGDRFVAEVRRRRPRSAGPLAPAGLTALRAGYAEQAAPVQARRAEARALARRLSDLVNAPPIRTASVSWV